MKKTIKFFITIFFIHHCLFSTIDSQISEQILSRAKETDSDSLLILHKGEKVVGFNEETPIECMSITKSVVELGIGLLLEKGLLSDLDQPICTYYPEVQEKEKRAITIRQLLNHTSGLASFSSYEEIFFLSDLIEAALSSEVETKPGALFFYNNKAVNILSGIFEKITGESMACFIEKELFQPLGITNFQWNADMNGHSLAMCGLELSANDLAKIGQLIMQKGKWNEKQILSEEFLKESLTPSQKFHHSCGLLWWLDREYRIRFSSAYISLCEKMGVPSYLIEALDKVRDEWIDWDHYSGMKIFQTYANYHEFLEKIETLNLDLGEIRLGPIKGYRADGYLGQYLIIIPEDEIIAIRQNRFGKKPDFLMDSYEDFKELVYNVVSK